MPPRSRAGMGAAMNKRKNAAEEDVSGATGRVDANKRKKLASMPEEREESGNDAVEEGEVAEMAEMGVARPADGQDRGHHRERDVQLDAELSAEEIQMMVMMGIPFGFATTQGKKVEDEACNAGAVKVNSKRSARQYMNRKGGVNKQLPSEKTGEKVPIEGFSRR